MASNFELSHSEPGTGSPPAPNTNHPDVSGDINRRGIRRDAPAIVNPNASTVNVNGHQVR
jgi:hypothetical protein